MEHIQAIRYGVVKGTTTVHAIRTRTHTWCGWEYLSDQRFDGKRVSLGSSTTRPMTCAKCAHSIRAAITAILKTELNAQEVEEVYEQLQRDLTDKSLKTLGTKLSGKAL